MACGGCGKKRPKPAKAVAVVPDAPALSVPPQVAPGQFFRIKGKPGLYLATANGAKPVTVMI